MTRTARVWIKGGRKHDEEIIFKDANDLFQQLDEMQARCQPGLYQLQVHKPWRPLRYPGVTQGDVELDMLPANANGEEGVLPSESPTLGVLSGVGSHEAVVPLACCSSLCSITLLAIFCRPHVTYQHYKE